MKTIDIIIPVYNSLEYADMCIRSVLRYAVNTDAVHARVTITDDRSDAYVARQLDKLAAGHDACRVIHRTENLGFVKNCNAAMKEADADIVVLLNSDTVVPPGFVEKIATCFESDPAIGIASPIASSSPFMNIPMLPGYNIFSMARLVETVSERRYPDIVTPEGFCYCIRRSVIEAQGYFDEIYGVGYCEESDYAMRALQNGFRTVCIDDLYIYHKRHVTFSKSERKKHYQRNRLIFDQRWASLYSKLYRDCMVPDPLRYLKDKITAAEIRKGYSAACRKRNWALWRLEYILWETGLTNYLGSRLGSLFRRGKTALKALGKSRRRLFALTRDYVRDATRQLAAGVVSKCTRLLLFNPKPAFIDVGVSNQLSVTFFLPDLRIAGGSISVVNLANELLLSGMDVRVVVTSLRRRPEIDRMLFEAIYFKSLSDLIEHLPPSDVYVATLWTTADPASQVARAHGALAAYFIQDYEVNFVKSARFKRRVRQSYQCIPHKFAKTRWLADKMEEEDCTCHVINPGMDLNIFYPASLNGAGRQNRVVLAMHRKGSFRRGAHILTEAMRLVKQARPDVTVRFFGDDLGTSTFEYEYAGRLPHKKLAACYRQADIYVDASMVHGFGRPGVEAMACGAVLVSTDSGGVREYAVDGENCLLAAVGDARDVADKVIRLLDDEILRKRLRIRALESIESYAEPIAAGQFLEWIDHLYNQKRTDLS